MPVRRNTARFAKGLVLGLTLAGWPAGAAAAPPGHTTRLGGIEAQGPASPSVTGLHYNPAMLAAMRGTGVHASLGFGLAHQRIRRHSIDPSTGAPTEALDAPTNLLHPTLGWFAGASVYFDPWAIGAGVYDVGSSYRLASANPVRFHLAPDPDPGCLRIGKRVCPPNGGAISYQQDATVALAWNGGAFQLGLAAHFPMVRERLSFDNDTELTPNDMIITTRCDTKEDPSCAERIGFKGFTHWIARDGAPPGFDAALSVGVGLSLRGGTVNLGARYRSMPVRRGGEVVLGGVGLVCRPDPLEREDEAPDSVPSCDVATASAATLRQRLPQQLSLGASALLGRSRSWRLDINLQWVDFCPGGVAPAQCSSSGNQTLRLVGLDRQAFVLPEFTRYRGLADVYSADAFVRYRFDPQTYLVFAGHVASPSVRRGADTADLASGVMTGASIGVRVRIPRTEVLLVPGYGMDIVLPRFVGRGQARYDPIAAAAFEAAGGDINGPGADAVLEGRGRPTNAGRYFGMAHGLSLAVLWGERLASSDWRLD